MCVIYIDTSHDFSNEGRHAAPRACEECDMCMHKEVNVLRERKTHVGTESQGMFDFGSQRIIHMYRVT